MLAHGFSRIRFLGGLAVTLPLQERDRQAGSSVRALPAARSAASTRPPVAAAASAAEAGPSLLRARLVDRQRTTLEFIPVEGVDGFLPFFTRAHLDETEAARLTGVDEKTSLVRQGLQALIARESARRLAALGGSEKELRPIPRRRSPASGR